MALELAELVQPPPSAEVDRQHPHLLMPKINIMLPSPHWMEYLDSNQTASEEPDTVQFVLFLLRGVVR